MGDCLVLRHRYDTLLLSQLSVLSADSKTAVNSLGHMVSPYLTPRSSGNMSLSFCSLIRVYTIEFLYVLWIRHVYLQSMRY
jgi:hypothetical protein